MQFLKVILFVLFLIPNNHYYCISFSEFYKGTLIIIVPCDEGILVCADKRIYRSSRGNDDNFNKIIRIDNYNGFAICGAPIVSRNNVEIFNVFDILNKKLEKEKISDNIEYWNHLCDSIRSAFISTALNAPYIDWPESQFPQNNYILFQIIFFHFNVHNDPKMFLLQFRYIKQINPIIEVNVYDLSVIGSFSSFGSSHVILELQNGNKPEFDYLRNDPKLSMILKNKVTSKELNLKDAINFCSQMIIASNKMYSLVSKIDGHIGPTFDLLLLSKNGLKFLNK